MSILQDGVGFEVFADTSQVDASMAQMEGTAASMAAGLEDKLAGASEGMKDLGKRSSGASRGIQGVAAVISLVDPRLGQVVRSVGTLARGLSVLRLGLGPAAVAVTAVTGALYLYQKEQQRTAAEMEEAEERANNLAEALQKVTTAAQDIEDQLRLVNGEIDQFGLAAEQQAEAAQLASDEVVKAYDAEIGATKEQIEALRARARAGESISAELRKERRELAQLTGARNSEIKRAERQIDTINLLAEFRRESREAAQREADADKEAAEAKRAGTKSLRERQRALEELTALEQESTRAVMSDRERLIALHDEEIVRIQQLGEVTGNAAAAQRALAAEEVQHAHDLAALQKRYDDDRQQRAEQAAADDRKRRQQEQSEREQNQQNMLTLYSGLTDAALTAAKKRAEGDEAASARAEAAAKAAALVEVGIARAVGIQNSVARFAGRPGATALAVAAQLASAAQQTAAILSAHQGANLAPDETRSTEGVRVLRDEARVGSRVLSPEASRRLERGEATGAQVVPVPVYQHFGQFFADAVEGGISPLTDMINAGRDVGRRSSY